MQKKPYRQVPLSDITFVLKMASFACFDDKMIVSNGIAGIFIFSDAILHFLRECAHQSVKGMVGLSVRPSHMP